MSTKEIRCIYCKGVHTSPIEKDSYICEYCGGLNYITTTEEDFKFQLANNNLSIYKFDEADDIYKKIIDESTNDKTTSMALMGRLLSYFGIVYVRGYGSKVTTPTFARYNPDIPSIKSSRYYKQLCNLDIDSYELQKYKTQIDELDKVYTRIDNDLNDTPEYDVFICTKISMRTKDEPNNKGYTEDSSIATKLYFILSKEGLNVFYSDITLKGVEYDSQIYSALSKSKTILVISSSKEYLESVWVESEWRRWLNFIDVGSRTKETFLLYLTEKGIEVPSILQKVQVIDYYKIYDVIDSIVNKDKKKEDKNQESTIDHLHNYVTKVIAPTCTQDGYTEHKCQICNHVEIRDRKPKIQHELTKKVIAPTCTEEGYTEYKCTKCGYTEIKDQKPTIDHKIEDGKCVHCNKRFYTSGLKFKLLEDNTYELIECNSRDKKIIIPETINGKKVTIIDPYAFIKNKYIEELILPNTIEQIDKFDRDTFPNLKFNTFGNVNFLGNETNPYLVCMGLTNDNVVSCQIHANCKVIAGLAFQGSGIKKIFFSNKVTHIGYSAFNECEELSNIILPESLMYIGDSAFLGCNGFNGQINIPSNVSYIGDYAFYSCTQLDGIRVDANNKNYKSIDNNLYSRDGKVFIQYAIGKDEETFIMPNGVNKIEHNAFSGANLCSIIIPDSIKEIGNSIVSGCNHLEYNVYDNASYLGNKNNPYIILVGAKNNQINSCKIHPNTRFILDNAFVYCNKLRNIVIPGNVKTIMYESFGSCSSLMTVDIPKSTTKIDLKAFNHCDSLMSINVDPLNPRYKTFNGHLYDKIENKIVCYAAGKLKQEKDKNKNVTTPKPKPQPKVSNVSSYKSSRSNIDAGEVFGVIGTILSYVFSILSLFCFLSLMGDLFSSCMDCNNCFSFMSFIDFGEPGYGISIIGIISAIVGIILAIMTYYWYHESLEILYSVCALSAPAVITAVLLLVLYLLSSSLSCMCDAACGWMTSINIPIIFTAILIVALKIKSKKL